MTNRLLTKLLSDCFEIVDEGADFTQVDDAALIAALESGLAVYKGKPLVNSVTGEEEKLEAILPLVQYFAYVEITDGEPQNLWAEYSKLQAGRDGLFAIQRIAQAGDIYPVFRELFRRRMP